ncbi:hypothetical protein O3P16_01600 [Chitinophagaceae bacterium LY-5]|uniref:Uncharacterized protein n=2 Tax=Polluticaenibacter yanchengensis TaxID=3014562 RepID=A0ABT4UF89_9BACT|nr:hypothetical protein [Chitinophagaceae bacterium LY-5]
MKMNQIYLKSFSQLQDTIALNKENISSIDLFENLLKWGNSLVNSKNRLIKNLYTDNFLYFKKINILDYTFEPIWYNLDDILESNIFKTRQLKLKTLVEEVRDILWELVVFKSNRECKIFSNSYMRVFTDESKENIFLCCDICDYMEDMKGNQVVNNKVLIPATSNQIKINQIIPSLDW